MSTLERPASWKDIKGYGVKVVSSRFGDAQAKTLAGYERTGGYQTLRKALAMRPDDIEAFTSATMSSGRIASALRKVW